MIPIDLNRIRDVLHAALKEDIGAGDVTSRATIPESATAMARYTTKQPLVVAGIPVIAEVIRMVDSKLKFTTLSTDGDYVDRVRGTKAHVIDTRKTAPGLRLLDKYAVACGGGTNHRMGLFDAVLIKNNHLAFHKSLTETIAEARRNLGTSMKLEVEVASLE